MPRAPLRPAEPRAVWPFSLRQVPSPGTSSFPREFKSQSVYHTSVFTDASVRVFDR